MRAIVALITIVVMLACAANALEKQNHPPYLVQISLNEKPTGKPPYTSVAAVDDLIEFSIKFPKEPAADRIRTLKVNIKGDAVLAVATVNVIIRTPRGGEDPWNKSVSCFVKAVKPGEPRIKITPIGQDGKARPAIEYKLLVVPAGTIDRS